MILLEIGSRIKRWLMPYINGLLCAFYKDPLYINAWVDVRYGRLMHRNWGDDINVYLIEKVTNKKVIVRQSVHRLFVKSRVNYSCIGSIIGLYENTDTIIWGSGAISKETTLFVRPQRICSVRGPLSRGLLLTQGFDCPEKYGDPALLVSRYYQPNVEKKFEMGFILHYKDENNVVINNFVRNNRNCTVIFMSNYVNWTDVVDQILSCETIVSSSLHGLIVSDSYKIPNLWITLSDNIKGGDFKYIDYFKSVNRTDSMPYEICTADDIDKLFSERRQIKYDAIINFDAILNSCPFL